MQHARTFYWNSTKKESTKCAMDDIDKILHSGHIVSKMSVTALGTEWAMAVIIFEEVEEDVPTEIGPKKNIMEQIEDVWGKTPAFS